MNSVLVVGLSNDDGLLYALDLKSEHLKTVDVSSYVGCVHGG